MIYFISIVHALTCIFIVLFILLQDPKGGVLGSLGGGGSKSFFGSEGASPFLVTVTKWLAICFACSSFYLSYMSSKKDSSILADIKPEQIEAPIKEKAPEKAEQRTSNEESPIQKKEQITPNKNQTKKELSNKNEPSEK